MNYEAQIANCQHSKLRAALQIPAAGGNWPTVKPAIEFDAEDKSFAEMKFYLYTGAAAMVSLMSFLVTTAAVA